MVVHDGSQPLYHQLYRVSLHHRTDRRQPLRLRLLAPRLRHGVHSPSHRPRRRLDLAGRSAHRLAKPPRLVVAQVRRQDPEVSVGPHHRLPLHHPLHPGRHAAAVPRHSHLLLAHIRSHPACQAASAPVSGGINLTQ